MFITVYGIGFEFAETLIFILFVYLLFDYINFLHRTVPDPHSNRDIVRIDLLVWKCDEATLPTMHCLPPMLALNAMPTTHLELFATAATSPAQRVPCL